MRLTVYDVAGHCVRNLVVGEQPAGRYTTVWDGRDNDGGPAASGVYFCRLQAGDFVRTPKIVIVR